MQVHIIGPNLSDQSKGDFHVHAKGCRDVYNSRLYKGNDHEFDRTHIYEVTSRTDASAQVYADQIAEGSMTATEGVATMWFAPCTDDLPSEEPMPEPPPIETFDGTPSPSVLVIGDPVDGIRFVGPFDTGQWAADYAERHPDLRNVTWWVAPIEKPVNQ